jgi:fluoroquinolone transport system permease protein
MQKLFNIFLSEVRRLLDYKIIYFGLIVTFLWVIVLAVTSEQEAIALLPQLLILDAGLMTIILIGSSFYFEKQEGTLKAILVSPVQPVHVIVAKVLASLVPSLLSVSLMTLTLGVIHAYWISYPIALLIITITTIAHLSLGFILMFTSPDFMSLLVKYSLFAFFLYVPSILVPLNLITPEWEWVALISPSYAAQYLIQGLFVDISSIHLWMSVLFLIALPSSLFPLYIYPQFKKETMKA